MDPPRALGTLFAKHLLDDIRDEGVGFHVFLLSGTKSKANGHSCGYPEPWEDSGSTARRAEAGSSVQIGGSTAWILPPRALGSKNIKNSVPLSIVLR